MQTEFENYWDVPEVMESVLNQNGDVMMMHLSQPMNIKTLLKRKKVMISTPFIGNWIITGSADINYR